jgi:hypothetical protein
MTAPSWRLLLNRQRGIGLHYIPILALIGRLKFVHFLYRARLKPASALPESIPKEAG